jgi:transcriptional regulator with XRE-family HTH domain
VEGKQAMSGSQVRQARHARGWTQVDLAERLGVSQPYVSLLESNHRAVPRRLASRLVSVLGMSATALPVRAKGGPLSAGVAASALGRLGYSGFAHLAPKHVLNPAELLVRTLRLEKVEARVVEALPWLVARYPDVDWNWLVPYSKQHDLQNRLGFVVTLARELAERRGDVTAADVLKKWEVVLEGSRLQKEDSFAGDALTEAERRWLKANRSTEAARWNLLSNVSVEVLASA